MAMRVVKNFARSQMAGRNHSTAGPRHLRHLRLWITSSALPRQFQPFLIHVLLAKMLFRYCSSIASLKQPFVGKTCKP